MAALVNANLVSVMAAVGQFLPAMLARNGGNIVGIGSVAALRGRGGNVAYAAAKRGLESYFESLRHRTASTGVRVQFYRLGDVDTALIFGRRLPFPLARRGRGGAHRPRPRRRSRLCHRAGLLSRSASPCDGCRG